MSLYDYFRRIYYNFYGSTANLLPKNDISLVNQQMVVWRSEGIDPYFYLDYIPFSGWYLLEYSLKLLLPSDKKIVSKIYYDDGCGFNEHNSIYLPVKPNGIARRVIFLPGISCLRFDPLESENDFIISKFSLKPISSKHAQKRLEKKISKNLGFSKNLKIREENLINFSDAVPNYLIKLYEEYNKIFSPENSIKDYYSWIKNIEFERNKRLYSNFFLKSKLPSIKFSLIVPIYNANLNFLIKAINSVENQSYTNWEVCLVDDASTNINIKIWLKDFALSKAGNEKYKILLREKNGHISQASNSGLNIATGDYVVLLDQDDLLAEHALLAVALEIAEKPDLKIIYSDEDKIDEFDVRTEPHFKPDWNRDLFLSNNYISHLGVYKRELLQQIGGFRVGIEGAQDYDLCLRCLPFIKNPDNEIKHIPEILYHWRISEGSTAKASSEKSYTWIAGQKALENYLNISDINAIVHKGLVPNTFYIEYPIPSPPPLVSIVIPTRDGVELLQQCISSILSHTIYQNYEIVVVDNDSVESKTFSYFNHLKNQKNISVICYSGQFNYSAINNFAIEHTKGSIIALLNNDIEVISENWLDAMVSQALRPEIGCVGAKLLYTDGTIQHGGVYLGLGGVANHAHKHYPREHGGYFAKLKVVQNFMAVTAACLVVRREIYDKVGGLDEKNLPVAFNDIDFCLRVREAGYVNLWTPYAILYHHESATRGLDDVPEKRARFETEVNYMLSRWSYLLNHDTYYNVNLCLNNLDFSLSFIDRSIK